MKFLCQGIQKLQPKQTDTQTEYENITFLHTQAVIIYTRCIRIIMPPSKDAAAACFAKAKDATASFA